MDLLGTSVECGNIELICDNCKDKISYVLSKYDKDGKVIIVSDPPFNVGYKYSSYNDKLPEKEYIDMILATLLCAPSVIIHYPEMLYKIAIRFGNAPDKVISWVYNSNTAKQHRDIAFFGIKPDFAKVRQPYKNLSDKRIQQRIAEGKTGAKLYDWWNINQVKNVSKEKTSHPCQMPLQIMENIIGILPDDAIIVDPYMGSGTTGVACRKLGRAFVGIEIDKEYYSIAKNRILGEDNSPN